MQIIKEEFFVPSRIDGCRIHVIRKHCNGGFPLLMLHGLSLPPQFNYDMPFDDMSAADMLAARGIDCYMMSALGYGLSSDPDDHFNRFQDWYRDIEDVMQKIVVQGILGWSASAIPAMMIAESKMLDKLVIYGIPRFEKNNSPTDPRPSTHRQLTIEGMRDRRYQDIPEDLKYQILPDRWFSDWEDSIQTAMPMRMPLGTEWDRAMIRRSELSISDFVDISKIQSSCLLTTGMWDTDIDVSEFYRLHKRLSNSRFRLIPDGTHWMLLETHRERLINILADFLIR